MRDVIIIGAGAGGPVIAKELAERGVDVLMLEAGPWYQDPENEWARFENNANNVLDGYFRFGPSDRSQPWWFRETPQNSLIWQLAGVGGTTQHYYGNNPRAMPGTFMGYNGPDKDAYDPRVFPFTYEELIPYWEWVEYTLPVQTAGMGTKESIFFRGAEVLGLPHNTSKNVTQDSFRPQENAILQPGGNAGRTTRAADLEYPKATGCTFCGYCFQGCFEPLKAPRNLKAKRSTDNSYVPMGITASSWSASGKDVEILPDAFVTSIGTTEQAGELVANSVTWRDVNSGDMFTEEAHVIVLAAGCTEDPRLWLNSGLPNPNGWVGKGYTDHFFDWVIGVFDEDTGSSKGVGSSARADFPGRGGLENVGLPPALQAFSSTFSDAGIRGHYRNNLGRTGTWDGDSGRIVGPELKALLADVDRLLNVLVITDDDVEDQNQVTLSGLPADHHGPVPKVTFHQRQRSARTLANREFLANKAGDLLRAAGARQVFRIDWPPLILHVQSTMRMGLSPDDSVLDECAESRWVKRLFIGDNAALANGIGGPNPTLTSQAVATRTAEKIFMKYFDGYAFVAEDTPIQSIDDRVTLGVLELPDPDPQPSDGEPLPATGAGLPVLGGAAIAAAAALRRRQRAGVPPDGVHDCRAAADCGCRH